MSLAFLFHYLMLSMFRMLIHPSTGACDLFVELFLHLKFVFLFVEGKRLNYFKPKIKAKVNVQNLNPP